MHLESEWTGNELCIENGGHGGEIEPEIKQIGELTLEDLCSEDHTIMASVGKKEELNIDIVSEDGTVIIRGVLHEFAAESLALFCKNYLQTYRLALKNRQWPSTYWMCF